jgi:hypothetical protein
MIEKLAEMAAGVVAVKVSGKLDHDAFAKLSEWIKAVVASQGGCRLLIEFGDFRGWDAEGLADDLRLHLIGSKDRRQGHELLLEDRDHLPLGRREIHGRSPALHEGA